MNEKLMCDFCGRIDDLTFLISQEVDCGALGEMEVDVCMDGEKGTLYLYAGSSETTFKINYCPMCGRKLGGEE